MSVMGLSIAVMAVVAAGGLLAALVAESTQAAASSRRFDAAGTVPAAPAELLRCRPRLLPKCPKDEKRVCLQTKGACCVRFGCRKSK
jgi:hypothetical protein